MNLLYIPDIEEVVLESCNELIVNYNFIVKRYQKNEFFLISGKCAIRIMAGISPMGERQIEIDFYDPRILDDKKKYYSHTFLLYLRSRSEPRDVLQECAREKENFDETIKDSLKCFSDHTIKYRQDILEGDFVTWRSIK